MDGRLGIDFRKAGTFPFLLLPIARHRNADVASSIYAGMHGGYGPVWLMKDLASPDTAWRRRAIVSAGLAVFFGVLARCRSFGWLLIPGFSRPI